MAADLDHRSPDASQWVVGSSSGVVGIGAREGSGARGCSARGGVGNGGGRGGGGEGGGGCWPNRGSSQPSAGGSAGTGARRTDIWGQSPNEAESAEVLANGSINTGVDLEQQLKRPGSRERRQRTSAARGGTGSSGNNWREGGEQGKGEGHSRATVSSFIEDDGDEEQGEGENKGEPGNTDRNSGDLNLHTPGEDRRKAVGAVGGGNAGADMMETDSAFDVHDEYENGLVSAGVDPGGRGEVAASVSLDEASEAEGAGSAMNTIGAHRGSGGDAAHRAPGDRLAFKLSVNLIDTYKFINQRYYAEKSRQQEQSSAAAGKPAARQGGVYNHGLDDENFDYIVHEGEIFHGRYAVRETIGKGSFGKVYKAWDEQDRIYVALKVIKSKRPFTMQARVEVEILEMLRERDPEGKYNCARMLDQFMSHNHQCLVFEILSFNLYELLRSTQFQGVSLHLVRKFARHLLRALAFLSLPQVDVIHCDLKPENILLQHPKRSNIKVIDFGSSCRSNNKMYSYIQSRFYRSPEVMLGLPYTTAIDMWSLGCILVEMHTGEPLFAGVDQFDQMCRIVSVLGMTPTDVVERSPPSHRGQFFEIDSSGEESDDTGSDSDDGGGGGDGDGDGRSGGDENFSPALRKARNSAGKNHNRSTTTRRKTRTTSNTRATRSVSTDDDDEADSDDNMVDYSPGSGSPRTPPAPPPRSDAGAPPRRYRLKRHLLLKRARSLGTGKAGERRSAGDGWMIPPRIPLSEVVGVNSGGPSGRREGEVGHDPETYRSFVELVERMLHHRPESRITPAEALLHPFLVDAPPSQVSDQPPPANAVDSHGVDSWLAPENSLGVGGQGQGIGSSNKNVSSTVPHPTTPEGVGGSGGTILNPVMGLAEMASGRHDGVDSNSNDREDNDEVDSRTSSSPPRPRSAAERRRAAIAASADGQGSGSAGAGSNENHETTLSAHDKSVYGSSTLPNNRKSTARIRYRGDGNDHDREGAGGGARRTRVGSGSSSGGGSGCGSGGLEGKGSGGGSSSSGGGRGGGTGAGASGSGSGSTRGRVAGVRRVRSRGLIGTGGVNHDGSAPKRPGQRSRKEAVVETGAGGTGEADDSRHGGHDRRRTPPMGVVAGGGGLAMETRRGRAARRGQTQGLNGAEGHMEAASGVAQMSLHSTSSTGRTGNRRQH